MLMDCCQSEPDLVVVVGVDGLCVDIVAIAITWFIDDKQIHKVEKKVSHPMHTSIILRTNKPGVMSPAVMELSHFSYTPWMGQ